MDTKQIAENMTRGEWRVKKHTWNKNKRNYSIELPGIDWIKDTAEECAKKRIAEYITEVNAEAIVLAVNETWKRGINPTAVSELANVCMTCLEYFEKIRDTALMCDKDYELMENLKQALNRAKLS